MRNWIRATQRLLSSRQLAVTLMISWTLLVVVWVIPFTFYGLPAAEINRIVFGELFFRVMYALILVATGVCIASRLPGLVRRVIRVPAAGAKPRAGASVDAVLDGPWDGTRAGRLLTALRMKHVVCGEGWAWGVRNRFSPLGTVLFHLAFFAIAAAAWLGLRPGSVFDGKTAITVGETFNSTKDGSFTDQLTPGVKPPKMSMTLLSLEPRFYSDILLFTKLQGVVRDGQGRSHRIALGSPWIVSPTTLVSVEDFGYSVTAEMRRADGSRTGPFTYRLKAFPSSMEDSFIISGTGGDKRVDVRVLGDYVDRNGVPGTKSFNLSNPRILVTVNRMLTTEGVQPIVKDRVVALGQKVPVGEDQLVFTAVPYHGVFRIARHGGAPLALLGLVLMVAGIAMRLVLPRQEVLIIEEGEGLSVFVRDWTYRRSPALAERVSRTWEGLE